MVMGFTPGRWGWGSAGTALGGDRTWSPFLRVLNLGFCMPLCSSGLLGMDLSWLFRDGPGSSPAKYCLGSPSNASLGISVGVQMGFNTQPSGYPCRQPASNCNYFSPAFQVLTHRFDLSQVICFLKQPVMINPLSASVRNHLILLAINQTRLLMIR